MPNKIKLKDRIKLNFKQPLWKLVLFALISVGWIYFMFLAGSHFLKGSGYCLSCGQTSAGNQECSSCDANYPCETDVINPK